MICKHNDDDDKINIDNFAKSFALSDCDEDCHSMCGNERLNRRIEDGIEVAADNYCKSMQSIEKF